MTQRVTDEQARILADADPTVHIQIGLGRGVDVCLIAADLLAARAEIATLRSHLAKVCEAGEYLLDANRTVNIYANDEWRTRRGGLEDAIAAAREALGEK